MNKPVRVPRLETQETRNIRRSYPSIAYLEEGHIAAWLQERLDQLYGKSQLERFTMETVKTGNLAIMLGGIVFSSMSPLLAVAAGVAGAGYVTTVVLDAISSHKICPIPGIRGNIFEFFAALGDRDAREDYFESIDTFDELAQHLPPWEQYEFRLLRACLIHLSDYLTHVKPGTRFLAYRWIVEQFILHRGQLPSIDEIKAYTESSPEDLRADREVREALREQTNAPQLPYEEPQDAPYVPDELAYVPQTFTPYDRDSLLKALRLECPAILFLIKAPPIRIVGAQRTGKTTFAILLGLLRAILNSQSLQACTTNYEHSNEYPDVFNVTGVTETGVVEGTKIYRKWIEMESAINGQAQAITYVWDEFADYGGFIPAMKLTDTISKSLRQATKKKVHPVFIIHFETLQGLPGVKGLFKPFMEATSRVEILGEMTEDTDGLPSMSPTGRFSYTGLDGVTQEGQLPSWLTQDLLLSILRG